MLKRHEIQVLLRAGFSEADVAERSVVSVDTVRRVRHEEQESTVATNELRRRAGQVPSPALTV